MARKQARRKRVTKKRDEFRFSRIPFTRIAASILALGFLVAVFEVSALVLDRPIRAIDIEAPLQRVTDMQIQAAIDPELDAGFVSANLAAMRQRLEALEWVDFAVIRRRWPDRLQILVVEQSPAARWRSTGLLNVRGELFVTEARHIPAELPRLSGPDGSANKVASRYLAINGRLIEAGLGLRTVELDARGAWRLTLLNGVEVRLGRRDVDARTERFLRIVTDVMTRRQGQISYVDMRYSNGFSIGWKSEEFRQRQGEEPDARPVLTAEQVRG